MKQTKFIHYQYIPIEELPEDEQSLLASAMEATEKAYAPYSEFQVGAAVLLEGGEIFLGNNQENRAYPSGMCAERTVLYYIGAIGKGAAIRKIAVRAKCVNAPVLKPVTPCGACRQVMVEYEEQTQKEIVVLMMGEEGNVLRIQGVKHTLMPFSFDAEF